MTLSRSSKTYNKNISIRVIDTLEAFVALEESWNTLYKKCERSTIFSSWEWMMTWWEVYHDQGQRELFILCFYQGEGLVGIAPFQIDRSFPKSLIQGKTIRFIGAGELRRDKIVSQYLDFLVLPDMEELMVELVSEKLIKSKSKWNFADFDFLLKDALIHACFSGNKEEIYRKKTEEGSRFFVPATEDFEQYLSKMGKRWRKMFRKKSRLIHRDGKVAIENSSLDKTIESSLKLLANMNCSRWKGKTNNCIFNSARFSHFHEKILKRLVPQEKAFIKTILLDDKALASYYAFTDKGKIHYYQSGFYPENANRYSPLFLLVCNEISDAIKSNKLFDFMHADSTDSYKKEQYAADCETMYKLKWSTHSFRFFIFDCAKTIQNRVLKFLE